MKATGLRRLFSTAADLALAALVLCSGSAAGTAAAAASDAIEPILVTAERLPLTPAESGRTVVITREEIARQPARSVEELLRGVAGVDVRRRGPAGVQADVSIRGATFEQTLVLIDGVKVTDPQTGHHNFDLPVAIADIERIEVLEGPATRVWGPNAFGGVINIVTRRPAGRALEAQAAGGGYGYRAAGGAASADAGGFAGRVSASASAADGYRHNTDFDISTLSFSGVVPAGGSGLRVLAGYTEKDFGANDFYSDRYPNQREDTETSFVSLAGDFGGGALQVTPRLFWRRHDDHYLLDSERPAFYENRHQTDVGGVEVQGTLESAVGVTLFGGEAAEERIDSSSLGDHERRRGGLFLNHRAAFGPRLSLAAGAFAAYHTDWGWKVWPGADLGYTVAPGARLFLSVDKSYRVPTYTELYYRSPANVGNPDLEPEEAWTCEGGAEWRGGGHRARLSVFRRWGTDLIDWVRSSPDAPWQAQNNASVDTTGVGALWEWRPPGGPAALLRSLRLGYAWLDSEKEDEDVESRYVLDYLRHQVALDAEHALPWGLSQSWRIVWQERAGGESDLVAETRLRRRFPHGEVFVEATNLFNSSYSEVGGVPQPGRWIIAGLKLDFGPW